MLYKGKEYRKGMRVRLKPYSQIEKMYGGYKFPFGWNDNMTNICNSGGTHIIADVSPGGSHGICIKFEDCRWAWHPNEFMPLDHCIIDILNKENRLVGD